MIRPAVLLCLVSPVLGIAQVGTVPGFDPKAIDKKVDPCVDFYQFACGTWTATHPIPPDQSRWGRFDELQERNREILRKILETAAAEKGRRMAFEQKIGDYYASCIDEGGANTKGITPLKPVLDRIAALPSKGAITEELVRLNLAGVQPFFSFDSTPDFKQSTIYIAELDQGGMGMPDRDYYVKTDPKSVELRKQYLAHMIRMFGLLGDPPDRTERKAEAVMRIETTLATNALDLDRTPPTRRVITTMKRDEIAALAPNFYLNRYFSAVKAPAFTELNVVNPDFFKQVNTVMESEPLDD